MNQFGAGLNDGEDETRIQPNSQYDQSINFSDSGSDSPLDVSFGKMAEFSPRPDAHATQRDTRKIVQHTATPGTRKIIHQLAIVDHNLIIHNRLWVVDNFNLVVDNFWQDLVKMRDR